MITCSTGKKIYTSQELAEEALLEAWTRFKFQPNNGPVAVYQCEDCGQYHLTSKGPMNAKLSQHLSSGTIEREQKANYWKEKFRKK